MRGEGSVPLPSFPRRFEPCVLLAAVRHRCIFLTSTFDLFIAFSAYPRFILVFPFTDGWVGVLQWP